MSKSKRESAEPRMSGGRPWLAAFGAVFAGVTLELGVTTATGHAEAWDAGPYWYAGLPLAVLVSGVLGYQVPRHAWVWGALLIPAQVLTMGLRNGTGPLMLVGLGTAVVLSVPCILAACAAARMRRARAETTAPAR